MITAYYLCHGHWTVIPHQLEENFNDMAECGFTAVALTFSESEMVYSRRAIEIQVKLAHKAGLKAIVIPSRVGGRFAGAPLAPSIWTIKNPQHAVPAPAWCGLAGCVEDRAFVDWFKAFMTTVLTDYPFDGIIWDEPKEASTISTHPATIAKYGPTPTAGQMEDSFVEFLGDIVGHCATLRPGLVQTLFVQKTDSQRFTAHAAMVPGVDYFGYDGNLSRQSFFHEEPAWLKYRIESCWDRTVMEAGAAGKKTFALIENMVMPAVAIPEYEANLDAYLATYRADQLAIYYYAHNNEDPERVHSITRRLMQKHLKP